MVEEQVRWLSSRGSNQTFLWMVYLNIHNCHDYLLFEV